MSHFDNSKFAVVVPMYNEELNIETFNAAMRAEFAQPRLRGIPLIVVNDGSKDGTLGRLQAINQDSFFHLVDLKKNVGYGAALLKGADFAESLGCEFALFMDSDLTNPPSEIINFVEVVKSNRYDLIKASRYMKGGRMDGVPAYRQFISKSGNLLAATLFGVGISDCTNGFRAIRLSYLHGIKFENRDFSLIMEELLFMKRKGARITQIPSTLYSRRGDIAGTSFTYKPSVFWRYLKPALKALFLPYRTQ